MQLQRNEIMTGLLVIGTIAVVAFLLVLLGAPGLFRPLVTYKIYFDNAAGIKQGAPVMLAGRKIGQVQKLFSPVSPKEEKQAEQAEAAIHQPEANASPSASATPSKPRFEVRVDVQVDKNAKVYRDAKTRMMQLGLLGDMAIDITQGTAESGRAKDGEIFAGERTPDLGEAAAKMLEVIKPVAAEATNTMKDLQQTAQNLNNLTDKNSELTLALSQFKTFGEHMSGLTAPDSALSHSLTNIEKISTSLTENDNIEVTLRKQLVREIEGGDDRARACGYKHQTIQRNNKNSAVAPDLAIDKKIRRSITNSRPWTGHDHRTQKRKSKATSPRNSHTYEQPLGRCV